MAVRIAIGGRGLPWRMAPASFPIVPSPYYAFGGWYHRVRATYGQHPVPAPGPTNVMAIPPGPTNGHTAATGYALYPTWSVVEPDFPYQHTPLAGEVPHGIPGITYTPASPNPPQDAVVTPQIRVRSGANQGRVTNQPRPTFQWRVQGVRQR